MAGRQREAAPRRAPGAAGRYKPAPRAAARQGRGCCLQRQARRKPSGRAPLLRCLAGLTGLVLLLSATGGTGKEILPLAGAGLALMWLAAKE